MKIKENYTLTKLASYIGYVVQAITVTFAPMLFVRFMDEFSLSIAQVSLIVTVTFVMQFSLDFASVFLVRIFSYRALAVTAHVTAFMGLVMMAFLPDITDPFAAVLISVSTYSIGSGLIEVVISPIVDDLPSEHKAGQMSVLHSFFCWGQVITVMISTLFFVLFGVERWRVLSLILALIPALNCILFYVCPISAESRSEKNASLGGLFKNADFVLIMFIMFCAGASEIAVSQWASAYCERGLGVSKTVGDIAGPMGFAFCMGSARVLYAWFGSKVKLSKLMLISAVVCIIGYLSVVFSPSAVIGLVGFAVCGFSSGVLWPGSISLASSKVGGGAPMYALLSFAGDAGCTAGPTLAGLVAALSCNDISTGIASATVFPVALTLSIIIFRRRFYKKNGSSAA